MVLHVVAVCSFSVLYIIPLHECNRLYVVGEHLGCFQFSSLLLEPRISLYFPSSSAVYLVEFKKHFLFSNSI